MVKRAAVLFVVAVAAAGCGSSGNQATTPRAQPPQVTVMTQNLYLGADLQPLFKPTQSFAAAAVKVLIHVQQSDFPARAVGIATEIKSRHPDLVGLQEVALWQTGPSCDQLSPNRTGGVDYLTTLLAALQQQGTPYRVAANDTNFTASATVGGQCAGFTDRDVILVRADRSDLELSSPQGHEYGEYSAPAGYPAGTPTELQITIPLNGTQQTVPLHRGWTSVDVRVGGRSFRFVDTHLEPYGDQYRDIQAKLLAQYAVNASPVPVIAVGDFNLRPDASGRATLSGSALVDAWPAAGAPGDLGYTSGQDDSLRNVPSKIDHRIDFILYTPDKTKPVALSGLVVGNRTSDMVKASANNPLPGPLWPSDHAGVIAAIQLLGS